MTKLDVSLLSPNLQEELERLLVAHPEGFVLCRDEVPLAAVSPRETPVRQRRPFGLARGQFTIPPSFFDPLPDDLLAAFEGNESDHHKVTTG
mgnify:CR=1 FL=1